MAASSPVQRLDLRQTKCPLNFVQARLALDKLATGQMLEVHLALASESLQSIPTSLRQEGHTVTVISSDAADGVVLRVQKTG